MSDETNVHIFETRNRAALTGTAFDFMRVSLLCAKCGKKGLQPIAKLIVNDTAPCPYCGTDIDISGSVNRAKIVKRAEEFKQIKPL